MNRLAVVALAVVLRTNFRATIWVLAFVGAGLQAGPPSVWADEGMEGKAKAVTVTGEVIDVACYTHDGDRGAKHEACARKCIGKGIPVGILDAKGQVYIAVTAKHEPGATLLMPHVAKMVKATGKIHTRGGVKVIVIESVEAAPGGTR